MHVLSKLFKLWALGKAVSMSIPPINRLLSQLATIGLLLIVAAMLSGSFLLGLLYFAYHSMIRNGVDPSLAMEIMGSVIVILIVGLLFWASQCWKRLHLLAKDMSPTPRASLSWRINQMTNSFLDGLMGDGPDNRRR